MTEHEDEFAVEATAEQLSTIAELIAEQVRLENEVEDQEAKLKDVKNQLRKVQESLLPDALYMSGLSEFKTLNGQTVSVKEDLSISIPKDKKDIIIKWLDENNHGDVVTGKIYVDLPKNSDNERHAAISALLDVGLEPCEDITVNASTLKAILKRHLANGDKVDLADFGAFAWKKSVIKRV